MQTTRSQQISTPLLLPHSDPQLHHQSSPNSPIKTSPLFENRFLNSNHKTSYSFHRSQRSLKVLNIHLKQYHESIQKAKLSTLIENVNTVFQANYEMTMSNNNSISLSNNKNPSIIRNSINLQYQQQSNIKNSVNLASIQHSNSSNISPLFSKSNKELKMNINGSQNTGYNFNKKCQQLVDNLIFNLTVFKKVFETTKKKRTVFSKLYGWDPVFNPVFFSKIRSSQSDQLDNNYSEQFKPNITRQSVIQQLNLQRKSFTSKNIYNKLRLFVAELTKANITHQQFQSKQQKLKLLQSSNKLRDYLEKLSGEPTTKLSTLNQVQIMRQTHIDMINMKMKIRNKGDEIKKFGNSGSYGGAEVKINPFYLKQQKNVSEVESFVKAIMKK